MADLADGLVGYQTYPHVDQRECGLKAAGLMARTVREEVRPVVSVVKPAMVINILGQETDREPMKSLMSRARQLERQPGILSVSIMAGFPYADVPDMGPAVIVVFDGDESQARSVADGLGAEMWKSRDRLLVRCATPEQAVRDAMSSVRRPVVLVDLGDNIGGGSAGDGTVLLREILRLGAAGALVVLYDPDAVADARRIGPGGRIDREVGGRVDRMHGDPVAISGAVRSLHDGKWEEDLPRHGGRRYNDQGATAVVDLDAGVTLVLNSLRTPPFSLGQITSLGIDPATQSVLVVKAAVAYKAAYAPIAGRVIEVDTPGLTAVDPSRFDFKHRRRPMYPFEP
jgi:microcystin degradation protein MlrC